MISFILRRLARSVVVLLLASIVIFFLVQALLSPEQAARRAAGPEADSSITSSVDDSPVALRYFKWIGGALHGDLGESLAFQRSVADLLGQGVGYTLALTGVVLALGVVLGAALAAVTARRRGRWLDKLIGAAAYVGLASPWFWVALGAICLFSIRLGWLPAYGVGRVSAYVLPALCLAIFTVSGQTILARAGAADGVGTDLAVIAGSGGYRAGAAAWWRAFRDGLPGALGSLGTQAGFVLSYLYLIERCFGMPGVVRAAGEGINYGDQPMAQGALLLLAAIAVLFGLLGSVMRAWLDPRVRPKERFPRGLWERRTSDPRQVPALSPAFGRAWAARSGLRGTMRALLRQRLVVVGLVVILLVVLAVVFVPVATHYYRHVIDLDSRGQGPSAAHWLGTDELGRDALGGLLHWLGRVLLAALGAVGMGTVAGRLLGLAAGYVGGWARALILRAMDALVVIPVVLLAYLVALNVGLGLWGSMVAFAVAFAPWQTRLMCAQTEALKDKDFVTAGTAAGVSPWRTMFRHILPNTLAPSLVMAVWGVGAVILLLTEFGYNDPAGQYAQGLAVVYAPGVMILVLVLGFFILGSGLKRALGPDPGRPGDVPAETR